MVNRSLRSARVFTDGTLAVASAPCCSHLAHPVARNPRSAPIPIFALGILLTVRGATSFCFRGGSQRMFAMIEMVTALMGLVGAGIFLAHAFEGVLFRA
jgi:hypothetical protein